MHRQQETSHVDLKYQKQDPGNITKASGFRKTVQETNNTQSRRKVNT